VKISKSLLKVFIFASFICLSIIIYQIYETKSRAYVYSFNDRVKRIEKYSNILEKALRDPSNALSVCGYLEFLQADGSLNLYVVKTETLQCSTLQALVEPIIPLNKILEFKMLDIPYIGRAAKINESYYQIAIVNPPPEDSGLIYLITNPQIIIDSLSDFTQLTISILLLFFFLVLMQAQVTLQSYRRSLRKEPKLITFLARIAKIFSLDDLQKLDSAATVTKKRTEKLEADILLLETSLEQSILEEIRKQSIQLPYTFTGTIARVDINGFSKLVDAGFSPEDQLLKAFEESACEVLRRYRGKFDKINGDEIVAVFTGSDSEKMAFGFCRDLGIKFSSTIFHYPGFERFTLKGAISSSNMQFNRGPAGYYFSGDGMTISKRLLDNVSRKDINVICSLNNEFYKSKALAKHTSNEVKFEFKNMKSESGFFVFDYLQIEEIYQNSTELIKFFRLDQDIIFLFRKILEETNESKINSIFDLFKVIRISECSERLIESWIESIVKLEKRAKLNPGFRKHLANLIVNGSNLIPKKQWDSRCSKALLDLDRRMDNRINSSVLEVLSEKDILAINDFDSFVNSNSSPFRVLANILVIKCIIELTDRDLSKIHDMITSLSKEERDAGLYGAARVILHYQQSNPAALETFETVKKIFSILRDYSSNYDGSGSSRISEMISRIDYGSP